MTPTSSSSPSSAESSPLFIASYPPSPSRLEHYGRFPRIRKQTPQPRDVGVPSFSSTIRGSLPLTRPETHVDRDAEQLPRLAKMPLSIVTSRPESISSKSSGFSLFRLGAKKAKDVSSKKPKDNRKVSFVSEPEWIPSPISPESFADLDVSGPFMYPQKTSQYGQRSNEFILSEKNVDGRFRRLELTIPSPKASQNTEPLRFVSKRQQPRLSPISPILPPLTRLVIVDPNFTGGYESGERIQPPRQPSINSVSSEDSIPFRKPGQLHISTNLSATQPLSVQRTEHYGLRALDADLRSSETESGRLARTLDSYIDEYVSIAPEPGFGMEIKSPTIKSPTIMGEWNGVHELDYENMQQLDEHSVHIIQQAFRISWD
jgi:hypothetical protein